MKPNEIQKHNYIEEFREALSSMINATAKAAAIYVKAIDEDPLIKYDFIEQFDGIIPASAWSGFEAVGRKAIHPNLLFGGVKHTRFIKLLPYSDQEAILGGKRYPLLIDRGDSINVDPREITTEQANQLFGGNHIRTLQEQLAYIKSLVRPSHPDALETIEQTAIQSPYKIANHKVYVRADTVFTKRELLKLIEVL